MDQDAMDRGQLSALLTDHKLACPELACPELVEGVEGPALLVPP